MKRRFTMVTILSDFDPGRKAVVEMDARGFALG